MAETVNHPQHYGGDTPYEVIKVLEHWLTREEFIGAMKFNIIKYEARANKKNGAEDYKKAAWYANYLADFMQRNQTVVLYALPTNAQTWAHGQTAEENLSSRGMRCRNRSKAVMQKTLLAV